jgi:PAS domain S-box-containing protein
MSVQTMQQFGSLIVDHDARAVFMNEHPIPLTNAEFTLLATLVQQPRHAFRSEYLLRIITGSDWVGDTHALQACVSRLRAKIRESGANEQLISTVRGFGYRFEPTPDSPAPSMTESEADESSQDEAEQSAFLLLNLQRRILWASESVESLLGWQPKGIEGESLYDLIHPDDQRRARAAKEGLNAGYPAAIVFRMRTAMEGYRHVEELARPLVGSHGRAVAIHGVFNPARDRLRAMAPQPSAIHLNTA